MAASSGHFFCPHSPGPPPTTPPPPHTHHTHTVAPTLRNPLDPIDANSCVRGGGGGRAATNHHDHHRDAGLRVGRTKENALNSNRKKSGPPGTPPPPPVAKLCRAAQGRSAMTATAPRHMFVWAPCDPLRVMPAMVRRGGGEGRGGAEAWPFFSFFQKNVPW